MKKLILLLTLIAFSMATSLPATEAAPSRTKPKAHARHLKAQSVPKAKKGNKRAVKKKIVRKQGKPRRGKA